MKLTRCLFVVIALMVLAGCAQTQAGEPMRVYGSAKTVVPVGYSLVGTTTVGVLPDTINIPIEGLYPYQWWDTEIYGQGQCYVLVQKMIFKTPYYHVKALQGSTAEMWGSGWRKGNYSLSSGTTDKEYARYFSCIREKGGQLAPLYRVAMYDQKVTPNVVARVISLTPTDVGGVAAMPSFNDLYQYYDYGNGFGGGRS
ncbi:hypothetical protein [Halodesulfovibrio spirochaetisodalis]|uniref:Lipoprotein n=1 Tax=Halodesulfovibrio spirochaetisodalis TaxID=1560234 RepID=A0A1B7XE43_9BACT|nr:hypothetical protein [Halodesulfovibrio spirochaetisodalis]OBQ52407.1 hypothetical protein SP90_07470 [Halodesulfovibrio spirochaetisodalis]